MDDPSETYYGWLGEEETGPVESFLGHRLDPEESTINDWSLEEETVNISDWDNPIKSWLDDTEIYVYCAKCKSKTVNPEGICKVCNGAK